MIGPSARRVAQLATLSLSVILCASLRTAEAQTRQSVDSIFGYIQRDDLTSVVSNLERSPARVTARNERGETPLHFAARLNNAAIVEALLAKNAEVDARDQREGQTPLFTWLNETPSDGRSIEVPRLLLAAGADMYARGSERGGANTPLQRLRERLRGFADDEEGRGEARILTAFDLPNPPPRAQFAADRALIELFQQHDAIGHARDGHTDKLAALIQSVPKAAAQRDRFGRTPLLIAVYHGRRDVVDLLIERGADPGAVDASGGGLLRACAYWNHTSLAKSLRKTHGLTDDVFTTIAFGSAAELGTWLDARAQDPAAKDIFGMSPLHWAVRRGAADRIQLLLTRRADPLAKDAAEWTALDFAACFGDAEACRLLAEAGQKAGAKPSYLASAFYLAVFAPDSTAFEALRAVAPKEDADLRGEALLAACRASRTDLVRRILDSSSDAPDASALTLAAARGNAELVTLLLDRGASVRAPDKFGGTPLHAAARVGQVHIVRLLLDRGAAVDQAATRDGTTPLRAAVERDDPIIVDMLLAAGADPVAPNRQGDAPTEYSTTDEVTRVLKRWGSKDERER